MPFFNAGSTIGETVRSILGQSFGDFELVAVDDGCTDGSVERLLNAAGADPRLRLVRPGRRGIVGAMNYGLSKARGEFVARMEDDPEAKIVVVSGYEESGPDGIGEDVKDLIKGYITKPCGIKELSLVLSQALEV